MSVRAATDADVCDMCGGDGEEEVEGEGERGEGAEGLQVLTWLALLVQKYKWSSIYLLY